MRVLIVEDNVTNKTFLRKVLQREKYEILEALNGAEAWEILKTEKVDLIITDWMMSGFDGIELIIKIRKEIEPVPAIILITALSSVQAKNKALEAGADEYIEKPVDPFELIERVKNCIKRHQSGVSQNKVSQKNNIKKPGFVAVCIAASTGGPSVLTELFSNIKKTNKAAFFIVLHGPKWMLKSFTQKIQSVSKMIVELADNDMPIKPGHIYLAPGEFHTIIKRNELALELSDTPPENYVKPAADPLFKSASYLFGDKCIGVVLTGMGSDGTIGSGYIAAANGIVIAQNPATATISAMPKTVIDMKIAKVISDLDKIPDEIDKYIEEFYLR